MIKYCENCKHYNKSSLSKPCMDCNPILNDNWKPIEWKCKTCGYKNKKNRLSQGIGSYWFYKLEYLR